MAVKKPIKIDIIRQQKGLTWAELAQKSGVNKRTLDMWAQRQRTPNDVYKLMRIAAALGVSLEDVIEPEEDLK